MMVETVETVVAVAVAVLSSLFSVSPDAKSQSALGQTSTASHLAPPFYQ